MKVKFDLIKVGNFVIQKSMILRFHLIGLVHDKIVNFKFKGN